MRHLRLFESEIQYFWLVDYFVKDEEDHHYILYPDKESAENYILEVINEEREQQSLADEEEYTKDMYFTDIKEALKITFNSRTKRFVFGK